MKMKYFIVFFVQFIIYFCAIYFAIIHSDENAWILMNISIATGIVCFLLLWLKKEKFHWGLFFFILKATSAIYIAFNWWTFRIDAINEQNSGFFWYFSSFILLWALIETIIIKKDYLIKDKEYYQ